ncbi:uncharacterized protein LOC119444116 [Dermacentor silvarum]|uniref:uncharacterized protein LOC119444116 n=1 Tax=Dermacentor silvarum TaxID=543639 RepID=UPI001896BC7A|nr:uncharacterized protein LOC119444116 [Dermacentor silvarum]
MKIAFLFVLAMESACVVQSQMNPLGSGLQRLMVGLFGARGGGRYGNPGAAYVQHGAAPQGNLHQSAYAGYGAPMSGNHVRSRPMFNNGMLPFTGGHRRGTPFRPAHSSRWRRHSGYPEDLVSRGFYLVRRQDEDLCVMRASCEAAAKPGEYGSEGELAVQFILSLRHDGQAPWQPYLLSARVGQAHRSLQLCRRIFRGCLLAKEQLSRTTRERLLKAIRCLNSRQC